MPRFCLLLSLVAAFATSPASAQNVLEERAPTAIDKPLSPPPPSSVPATFEPSLREPKEGRYPPTRFSVAPASERTDLTLYREHSVNPVLGPGGNHDNSTFSPLCTLPCEVNLRPRPYVFGVRAGDRAAVKVREVIDLRNGQDVHIHYDSRLGMRIFGWTLLLAGTAAGGLLLGSGIPAQGDLMPARVATGAGLMATSLVLGLWFANLPDRAYAFIAKP